MGSEDNGIAHYVHLHITPFHQCGWRAGDVADSIWSTPITFSSAVAAELSSCLERVNGTITKVHTVSEEDCIQPQF